MRIRRSGQKHRDKAAGRLLCLDADLPSEIRLDQDYGKLSHGRDAKGAGAFLLQVFITRDLGQNRILKSPDNSLPNYRMSDETRQETYKGDSHNG